MTKVGVRKEENVKNWFGRRIKVYTVESNIDHRICESWKK